MDSFDQSVLLKRLLLSSKVVAKQLDNVYANIELKKSSFEVLAALHHAAPDYALTPNELIELTHVTSGSMTSRIDKLVKKGWVERVVNKQDKRSKKVSLTEAGKVLIESTLEHHDKALNDILSCWTEKEQQRLAKILGKLTERET